jgi:hypothetical protein
VLITPKTLRTWCYLLSMLAGLAAGYALDGATERAVAALGEARKLIAGRRKVRDGRGVTAAPSGIRAGPGRVTSEVRAISAAGSVPRSIPEPPAASRHLARRGLSPGLG